MPMLPAGRGSTTIRWHRLRTRSSRAAATLLVAGSLAACSASDPAPDRSPGPTASTPAVTAAPTGPASTAPTETAETAETAAPPTPGDVESTVEAKPIESRKPVRLDTPSATGTGLAAKLLEVRAVDAKAQLPGEVAGPALALTLEVRNEGRKAADLSAVVVNVTDSAAAPGTEMSAEPAQPFRGSVGAGKSVRAVYVFTVPKDKRDPITVTVSIGEAPVLVFTGDAS